MNYIKISAGLLALFATAAILTGCFKGGGEQPIDNVPKDGVTLNIAVPGMTTLTRANDENKIEYVDVIVFDSSGEFAGHYTATEIHQNAAQTTYQYFISGLELIGDFEVVVVANYPAVVAEALTKAEDEGGEYFTKEQFVEYLEFRTHEGETPAWYIDFWPIPMYGETKWNGPFSSAADAVSVELIRAISYMEVQMHDSYMIEYITFRDLSCDGLLRPNYENPLEPNLPLDRKLKHYATYPKSKYIRIYTLEAPAPTNDSDGYYIVLMLKYDGTDNYYRIDMAWDGTVPGTVRGERMPLLRNYKYYVNINQVLGPGSSTLEEARKQGSELNNLDYTVHMEDQGRFEKVAYDGRYMLGVQKKSFNVTADEQVVKFLASSNYPGYWTADATPVTWLEVALGNEELGSLRWTDNVISDSATGLLSVRVGKNATGISRQGDVLISSGQLSIPVTIIQSNKSAAASIEIIGCDQSSPPYYQLLWNNVSDPKGILIKWTPADAELKITKTIPNDNEFVYGEDSDSFDDYTSLRGGSAIFNIHPPGGSTLANGNYQTLYKFSIADSENTVSLDLLNVSLCGENGEAILQLIGNNSYLTHKYAGKCWMVQNSMEGTYSGKGYGLNALGQPIGTANTGVVGSLNGYYYTNTQAASACPSGWHLPSAVEAGALRDEINNNLNTARAKWWAGVGVNAATTFAGFYGSHATVWELWGMDAFWLCESGNQYLHAYGDKPLSIETNPLSHWNSVRCVKD